MILKAPLPWQILSALCSSLLLFLLGMGDAEPPGAGHPQRPTGESSSGVEYADRG